MISGVIVNHPNDHNAQVVLRNNNINNINVIVRLPAPIKKLALTFALHNKV